MKTHHPSVDLSRDLSNALYNVIGQKYAGQHVGQQEITSALFASMIFTLSWLASGAKTHDQIDALSMMMKDMALNFKLQSEREHAAAHMANFGKLVEFEKQHNDDNDMSSMVK